MGKGSSKLENEGDGTDREFISEPHKNIPDFPYVEKHENLMAKCLTPKIWMQLCGKETNCGSTLNSLIHIGVNNKESSPCNVGVLAGDEESYSTFRNLLNPVIKLYHGYKKDAVHHSYTDASKILGGSFNLDYVLSCRVSVVRAIHGYKHPPHCTRAERREIENLIHGALQNIPYPYNGTYYPLEDIPDLLQHQLNTDPMLCDKPTCSTLKSAGLMKDWPDGRGIWINEDHKFIVWINDKEHVRIIWREPGGNMTKAFTLVYNALAKIEEAILENGYKFQQNVHLGNILSCPTKLGTGMIAEVHMKLPYFRHNDKFEDTLEKLRLQMMCNCKKKKEHRSQSDKYTVYLSNIDSLGMTEVDIVQHVIDSVNRLIEIDKRILEQEYNVQDIDFCDLLPAIQYHPLGSYPNLRNHTNLLAQCLTPAIYYDLMIKNTKSGFSLDQCIQTGVDNPYMEKPGVVAGDDETYILFSDLLNNIIEKCHQGYKEDQIHPTNLDYSQLKNASNLDSKYVRSCRICLARNIKGFCLPPHCTRAERGELEDIVTKILAESVESDMTYISVNEMTEEAKEELIRSNVMFKRLSSRIYTSAGMTRDWPQNRGIIVNEKKDVVVWINVKDHYRLVSSHKGADIATAFEYMCVEINEIENLLQQQGREFMWSEHLGYITTCPSNLGTGMKASVLVKFPKLLAHQHFIDIVDLLKLSTQDVDNTDENGEVIICTVPCLGISEVEQIQTLVDGIRILTQIEKRLEKKKSIEDLIPKERYSPQESLEYDVRTMKASNYPKLHNNETVMAQILNEDLYEDLRSRETKSGFTLDDCIQIGLDSKFNGRLAMNDIGILAGDEECYQVFAPLFDPIISEIHNGYGKEKKHPTAIVSKKLKGGNNVEPDYVCCCMVSAVRCIRTFSLAPHCTRQERRDVERIVTDILKSLPAQYQGQYVTPSDEDWDDLDWYFCKSGDMVQLGRDWPESRGVWCNRDRTFYVMVNPEDHIKIICSQESCNMKAVFDMFCDVHKRIETALKKNSLEFMYSKHLGYIQTCPSRLGTGLHVGMDVRLSKLLDEVSYCELLKSLGLCDDPCLDRNFSSEDEDIVHISNQQVLGISEADIVQNVVNGVKKLVDLERKLEKGGSID